MDIKTTLSETTKSIYGGLLIALGCIANLSSDNRLIGAFLFSIGLITICKLQLNLYTGKIAFGFNNDTWKIFALNCISIIISAMFYSCTRICNVDKVISIVETKIDDYWFSLLYLAVACEICIIIAVVANKKLENSVVSTIIIALAVTVFVYCGFEHCIADLFYFTVYAFYCHTNILKILLDWIIIILGNTLAAMVYKEHVQLYMK